MGCLDVQDGRGVAVPFLVAHPGPLPGDVGAEGRVHDRVPPSPFAPFLGIVEHVPLLVHPQETEVDVVHLGHGAVEGPDDLEGETAVGLVVAGDVFHLLGDGVAPEVHLAGGPSRNEGEDGNVVADDEVHRPLDDAPQGRDGLHKFQQVVRVAVPVTPLDVVLPVDGCLRRGDDVPLQPRVDGRERDQDLILFRIAHIESVCRIALSRRHPGPRPPRRRTPASPPR